MNFPVPKTIQSMGQAAGVNPKWIWILIVMMLMMLMMNMMTVSFVWIRTAHYKPVDDGTHDIKKGLYLLEHAKPYVYDEKEFEEKVREVSSGLDIPPEWLMAVMHSESRFDASIRNTKGSGATGLIQFMPFTAKDHQTTVDKLRNMNHVQQLDYVYDYLNNKRRKYKNYDNLTELYLAILYPKALGQKQQYVMYAKPSISYKMNKGLDQNKDGRVTVSDIDSYLKRIYPTAYKTPKPPAGFTDRFFSSFK